MKKIVDAVCPMRDGVELRMDLYLPEDGAPHPVILMRTPYGKGGFEEDPLYGRCQSLVEDGYVVAVEDCRGNGHSAGRMRLNGQNEHQDGYDTVEYLAGQPYCDGNVGMFGLSYFGFTQAAAASTRPPHLKAACPFMCCSRETFGASRMHTVSVFHLSWAYGQLLQHPEEYMPDPAVREKALPILKEYREKLSDCAFALPLSENPAAMVPGVPMLEDYLELMRGVESREFWDKIHCPVDYDKVHAALLFGTGWLDGAHESTIDGYQAARASADPVTREGAKLLIGPWTHGGALPRKVDDADYGDDASGDAQAVMDRMHRFFDRHLKGKTGEDAFESRVRYFVLGENRWREADEWPPVEAKDRELYLGDGTLAWSAGSASEAHFTYDPMDPMPAAFKDSEGRGMVPDWSAVSDRADVLTYSSLAFDAPLTLAGGIRLRLFAATDAKDTDFSCRVLDVDETGRATEIAAGLVRARYRNGMFEPCFITPGEVTEYEFEVGNVAITFPAGHKIAIQLSSALYPRFNRSLNTDASFTTTADYVVAHQTVFAGGEHASRLILPVME